MKKLVVVFFAMLPLMGCHQVMKHKNEYIRDRGKDYLTSNVIEPLKIPEELSYPGSTEYYPVPEDLPCIGQIGPVSLVPPGFGIISEVSGEEIYE